ncbi:MAG: hypothetical protein HY804_04965 [Nitrospinae bacterium]|nr:hypothetical protein [Nitrospinota bacterium]
MTAHTASPRGRAALAAAAFCVTLLAGWAAVAQPERERLLALRGKLETAHARETEVTANITRIPALEREAARLTARRNGLAARHERMTDVMARGASLDVALAAVEEVAAIGALELREASAPEPGSKENGASSAFWSAPLTVTVACDYRAAARLLQKLAASPAALSLDAVTLTNGGTGAPPLLLTARMTMYGRRGGGS